MTRPIEVENNPRQQAETLRRQRKEEAQRKAAELMMRRK